MAALEAANLSIFSIYPSSSSKLLSSSSKLLSSSKPLLSSSIKLNTVSYSTPSLSINFPFSPLTTPPRSLCSQLFSAVQEASVEVEEEASDEEADETKPKKKLYVFNIPFSFSVADIQNLFVQCGTVKNVEIVMNRDGKSRGYAFVTMASSEEAQAAIQKFDSYEVSGRTLTVAFSKTFRKPSPRPPTPPAVEINHRLYVANIARKVRASHLRELFSAKFKPLSCRVLFSNKGSSGYGFVGFATKEEAEAAISAFNGKVLMGRPLRLALSDKNIDKSVSKNEEEDLSEGDVNSDELTIKSIIDNDEEEDDLI